MKNLRKWFNILNSQQEQIIQEQVITINGIINEQQDILSKKIDDYIKEKCEKNKICSKCGSDKVVDKILNRTRSVTDSFQPLLGIRNSHIESYTEDINHCSNCNHEWEKYDHYDDWSIDKDDYFEKFYEAIKERKQYEYIFEKQITPYKEFYAESIYRSFKDICEISLFEYRQIFRSIFDK